MNRFTRVVRAAPKPQTPVEALQLAEDIDRIKWAIEFVSHLSPLSICDSREEGEMQIRAWIVNLRRCNDHAQQKLRRDFLSVEPQKRYEKKQAFSW